MPESKVHSGSLLPAYHASGPVPLKRLPHPHLAMVVEVDLEVMAAEDEATRVVVRANWALERPFSGVDGHVGRSKFSAQAVWQMVKDKVVAEGHVEAGFAAVVAGAVAQGAGGAHIGVGCGQGTFCVDLQLFNS